MTSGIPALVIRKRESAPALVISTLKGVLPRVERTRCVRRVASTSNARPWESQTRLHVWLPLALAKTHRQAAARPAPVAPRAVPAARLARAPPARSILSVAPASTAPAASAIPTQPTIRVLSTRIVAPEITAPRAAASRPRRAIPASLTPTARAATAPAARANSYKNRPIDRPQRTKESVHEVYR
jgi:hypothetical protein